MHRLSENSQSAAYDAFKTWIEKYGFIEQGPEDEDDVGQFPRYADDGTGNTYVVIDDNGILTIVGENYYNVTPEQLLSITPEDIDNGWTP